MKLTFWSYLIFHPLAMLWLSILALVIGGEIWSHIRRMPSHPYPASTRWRPEPVPVAAGAVAVSRVAAAPVAAPVALAAPVEAQPGAEWLVSERELVAAVGGPREADGIHVGDGIHMAGGIRVTDPPPVTEPLPVTHRPPMTDRPRGADVPRPPDMSRRPAGAHRSGAARPAGERPRAAAGDQAPPARDDRRPAGGRARDDAGRSYDRVGPAADPLTAAGHRPPGDDVLSDVSATEGWFTPPPDLRAEPEPLPSLWATAAAMSATPPPGDHTEPTDATKPFPRVED